jgi:anaerobic ribonucleoside-triphosphate reductase
MRQVLKRDGTLEDWDIDKIKATISKALDSDNISGSENISNQLIIEVSSRFKWKRIIPQEEIQDIVEKILIEKGYLKAAKNFIIYREKRRIIRESGQLQIDIMNTMEDYIKRGDWRVRENSNIQFSYQGLLLYLAETTQSKYCLNQYPEAVRNAHMQGFIHIHDLGFGLAPYCSGWSLGDLLREGFNNLGYSSSYPPKNFTTALNQIVNFFGTLQNEWAGAQAINSIDTYLAPFIKFGNLSHERIYDNIQSFIYNLNITSRWGGQSPFSNLTLDVVCPNHMKNEPIIIGGEVQNKTYGEFQNEMDLFNKAFLEVLIRGDRDGRIFSFPIPTYNITKDFPWNSEFGTLLAKMTGKYGVPYFQNFINSDLNPEDVRSMCCRLRLDKREIIKKTGGLFGAGDLTGCYDDQTEILTNNGWKLFKDLLEAKDLVLSMDGIKNIEWVKINERLEYDYKGEMISFNSNNSSFRVTPNHRMLEITSSGKISVNLAEDILDKKWIKIPVNNPMSVLGEEFFVLPELKLRNRIYPERKIPYEIWACFMGIFLSEGSTNTEFNAKIEGNSQGYRVIISQIEGVKGGKILELLEKLPWHFNVEGNNICIYDKPLWLYLKQFGNRYEKYIPEDLKRSTFKVLKNLWDWLLLGDGYINKGDTEYYWTTSKRLRDDVQEILILMGHRSNSIIQNKKDSFIRGRLISKENQKDCFCITKQRGRVSYINNKNTKKEWYSGKVYCVNVKNNTVLIRRNGKVNWCGNSVGVITINLVRLGYLAKDKEEFFDLVKHYANIAKNSLEIKRKTLKYNLEHNMFPWSKRYLKRGFDGHFSTIGVVAGHEACLNLLGRDKGIDSLEGKELMIETLKLLRDLTIQYQEETGNLYNLEATPAEGCTYRLAKLDKKYCSNIIQSGSSEVPFYTNSTQLPVDKNIDILDAIEHQSDIQILYSGGVVFHTYLGESVEDPEAIKTLITKIFTKTKLPFLSITPTFSICSSHGYIRGEFEKCPQCGGITEIYSRVVGYYRKVASWNISKQEEFKNRKVFKIN